MPFVDKVWIFNTSTEGWIDDGSSGTLTFAFGSGVGNPPGSVVFTSTTPVTNDEEAGKTPAGAGQTWNTWGIPSGRSVTTVQIASIQTKLEVNTGVTANDFSVEIVDATLGGAICRPVDHFTLSTSADVSFVTRGPFAQVAVPSAKQASSQGVRFFLFYRETSSGTTNIDMFFDNIVLRMFYPDESDAPPIGVSGRGAGW